MPRYGVRRKQTQGPPFARMRQIVSNMEPGPQEEPAPAPEVEPAPTPPPEPEPMKAAVAPPPEPEVEAEAEAEVEAERKRARDDDGHFVADDPETPEVDEAWEAEADTPEEEAEAKPNWPEWNGEMTKKELLEVVDTLKEMGLKVASVSMKSTHSAIMTAIQDAIEGAEGAV
jgi:hypothetical protein